MDIITFGTGVLYGTATNDASGAPLANPTPVAFSQLQDVSFAMSFTEKMLYGSGQFPIALGRGEGKIDVSSKVAAVNAQMYGNLFLGITPQAGVNALSEDNAAVVPASVAYTITATPPGSGVFAENLGVKNALTGALLTRVAGTPATGQYAVNEATGVYTFAAADANLPVTYSFRYTGTSTVAQTIAIKNQRMGYMPFFRANLAVSYAGAAITIQLNRVASSKIGMGLKNTDFSIPDFTMSAFADAAGNIGVMSFSQ